MMAVSAPLVRMIPLAMMDSPVTERTKRMLSEVRSSFWLKKLTVRLGLAHDCQRGILRGRAAEAYEGVAHGRPQDVGRDDSGVAGGAGTQQQARDVDVSLVAPHVDVIQRRFFTSPLQLSIYHSPRR